MHSHFLNCHFSFFKGSLTHLLELQITIFLLQVVSDIYYKIPLKLLELKSMPSSKEMKNRKSVIQIFFVWLRCCPDPLRRNFLIFNIPIVPAPPPKKKKNYYNRSFSINNFQNCELTWICLGIIKITLVICISAKPHPIWFSSHIYRDFC